MLKNSNLDPAVAASIILNAGFDAGFVAPTKTALEKSIIDAHDSLRSFLRRNNIHDYEQQKQGEKVLIHANCFNGEDAFETKISFYRPNTKDGDPRIWIYGLKELAAPNDLIAIIFSRKELHIINCSTITNLENTVLKIIPNTSLELSPVASELLQKLKIISNKGYVRSLRNGDTGVGMTLETLLGISANSNRAPDYKGIEIKSSRIGSRSTVRHRDQLFSKVPKWSLSPCRSAKELVIKRGYLDEENQMALRHTVSGLRENSRGLKLVIDYLNDHLQQVFIDITEKDFSPIHDITWLLEDLRSALRAKHKETFWVKAKNIREDSYEKFHYVHVEHTKNPYIERLESLIENGIITLDYTLHIKDNGTARDHGYLFKLKQNSLSALFPSPIVYNLENF